MVRDVYEDFTVVFFVFDGNGQGFPNDGVQIKQAAVRGDSHGIEKLPKQFLANFILQIK